jgi:hypothetical protein
MSAASNYLEDQLLDHVLTGAGGAYSAPATVYVALFADAGSAAATALESGTSATGSGDANWGHFEINNASYARQAATFASASGGSISTGGTISFPVASADYNTAGTTGSVVTHLAIIDASSGGNVLFYGALTNSKTVNSGDQFTISTGNLTVSLA